MNSFTHLKNNIRTRICTISFCIGIGTDQLTPKIYRYSFDQYLGQATPRHLVLKHDRKEVKINSVSLQKSNYGRKARNQNM